VKQVIKGVHIVPMGFANAFLIEGDGELTLIDAGFPDKEAAVFGAIRGTSRMRTRPSRRSRSWPTPRLRAWTTTGSHSFTGPS
jgi:hypothetical protein